MHGVTIKIKIKPSSVCTVRTGRISFTFDIGNFYGKSVKKLQIWLKTGKNVRHIQRPQYILLLLTTYICHNNIFWAKLNFLYRQLHDNSKLHTGSIFAFRLQKLLPDGNITLRHKYIAYLLYRSYTLPRLKTFACRTEDTLLYAFFWVIPRRLNLMCQRFGALCLFHFIGR